MEEQNKHWTNRVQHISADDYDKLCEKLNAFYKDRFVIATQIFPNFDGEKFWVDAVVYFKVPPKSN